MSICTQCDYREAETRDGLLCKKCLREWSNNKNHYTPPAIHEMRDRSCVSTQVIGGAADMREAESMR